MVQGVTHFWFFFWEEGVEDSPVIDCLSFFFPFSRETLVYFHSWSHDYQGFSICFLFGCLVLFCFFIFFVFSWFQIYDVVIYFFLECICCLFSLFFLNMIKSFLWQDIWLYFKHWDCVVYWENLFLVVIWLTLSTHLSSLSLEYKHTFSPHPLSQSRKLKLVCRR